MSISVIKKRDGRIAPFDVQKISDAIQKSFVAGEPDRDHEALADSLAWEVYSLLDLEGDPAPTVEHVQDIVEQVLMREGYSQTAKSYILYRQERTNVRNREAHGRGSVTVAAPAESASLTERLLLIYQAVRDNGGCERLIGFYDTLAPGVDRQYSALYHDAFRLALELCDLRVSEKTLRTTEAALQAEGLTPALGQNESWRTRQLALLCELLECDPAPLERAQNAAAARAAETLLRQVRQDVSTLLRALDAAGCEKDAIDPGVAYSPAIRLLKDVVR